jgi:hypothetical protein
MLEPLSSAFFRCGKSQNNRRPDGSGSTRALNGVQWLSAAPPLPTGVVVTHDRRRDRPDTDRHAAVQQIFEVGQKRPETGRDQSGK